MNLKTKLSIYIHKAKPIAINVNGTILPAKHLRFKWGKRNNDVLVIEIDIKHANLIFGMPEINNAYSAISSPIQNKRPGTD